MHTLASVPLIFQHTPVQEIYGHDRSKVIISRLLTTSLTHPPEGKIANVISIYI